MIKTLNKAIAYNLWLALSGILTALVVTFYFSKELQGVYFTITSLIAIKAILDVGFSNVILSYVALNKNKLIERDRIIFNEDGFKNISNIFLYSKRRFKVVSCIGFVVLQILGGFFFSDYIIAKNIFYWVILTLIFSGNILMTPYFSVIEGLDYLDSLFSFRLKCAVTNSLGSWLVILLGGGVLCIIALNILMLIQNFIYLRKFSHLFSKLNEGIYDKNFIRPIVKPMSIKISLAWASNYFTSNGLIPFLFKYISPVVAGQFGLSWALLSVISTVSKQFVIVNRPKLGSLFAENSLEEFSRLFVKIFLRGLSLFLILAITLLCSHIALDSFQITKRLLPYNQLLLLSVLFLTTIIMGYFTHFFRAQLKEPLYISYVLVSLSLLITMILNVNSLSVNLVIYTLIAANVIFGFPVLIYSLVLFYKKTTR
jgi:hypothetical protein